MKVALIGASGNVGSRLLEELVRRGHEITAIAREPAKISARPHVTPKQGDVSAPQSLSELLKGHEAVISAVPFRTSDPAKLIEAIRGAGVTRYLVVGGAGSLEVAPGVLLMDGPDFPEAYKQEAQAGKLFLDALREEKGLDWTFLSPSALFEAGERTGVFRLGKDQLLSNETGSRISFEDFSVAMVDELEHPHHSRQRFTVGY